MARRRGQDRGRRRLGRRADPRYGRGGVGHGRWPSPTAARSALAELWCGREPECAEPALYLHRYGHRRRGDPGPALHGGEFKRASWATSPFCRTARCAPATPRPATCKPWPREAQAIANRARAQLRGGPESLLLELAEGHPRPIMAGNRLRRRRTGRRSGPACRRRYCNLPRHRHRQPGKPLQPGADRAGRAGRPKRSGAAGTAAPVQRRAMAYPLSAARIVNSTLGPDSKRYQRRSSCWHASELLFARN